MVLGATDLFDAPPVLEAVASYLGDSRNIFLLAQEGARPIGFLRGTELTQLHSTRKQMFLYEIAVGPEHRRKGVGRRLVEALLAFSREQNFEEMFVFTDDPGNTAAHRLYRSTGGVTETPGERMYVYRL